MSAAEARITTQSSLWGRHQHTLSASGQDKEPEPTDVVIYKEIRLFVFRRKLRGRLCQASLSITEFEWTEGSGKINGEDLHFSKNGRDSSISLLRFQSCARAGVQREANFIIFSLKDYDSERRLPCAILHSLSLSMVLPACFSLFNFPHLLCPCP